MNFIRGRFQKEKSFATSAIIDLAVILTIYFSDHIKTICKMPLRKEG